MDLPIYTVEQKWQLKKKKFQKYVWILSFLFMSATICMLVAYTFSIHISYRDLKNEYDVLRKLRQEERSRLEFEKLMEAKKLENVKDKIYAFQNQFLGYCQSFSVYGDQLSDHLYSVCNCNAIQNFKL